MGFFDSFAERASAAIRSSRNRDGTLREAVLDVVRSELGGVSGLIERLRYAGLHAEVVSWADPSTAQPLTMDQLRRIFGPEGLAMIAAQVRLEPALASASVARLLPGLVNEIAPQFTRLPDGSIRGKFFNP